MASNPSTPTNGLSHGELTDVAYWDTVWQRLNRVSVISAHDRRFGRRGEFLRMVQRYVGKLDSPSVLELGGAWSYKALALAKWWGASVSIIDQSPVGIATTQTMFEVNGCTAEIILGDFFRHSFGGRKFDLVLHFGLLEHFSDPAPVIRLCADLPTEGGNLLFTMPNMAAWGAALWRRWAPCDWSKHIYHTDDALKSACEAAGLELTQVFYWGPPILQIALWERKGLLPKLVTLAQGMVNLPGKLLPVYDRGWRTLSMHRGFVATRVRKTQSAG